MRLGYVSLLLVIGFLSIFFYYGFLWAESSSSKPDTLSNLFESRYDAWKRAMSSSRMKRLGDTTMCTEWEEIVELGPLVVPFVVEKIQNRSHNGERAGLRAMLYLLTWRYFKKSEWPEGRFRDIRIVHQLYIKWWCEGRVNTPKIFEKNYARWKLLKSEGKPDKAQRAWKEMLNLGTDVLPLVVEKIKAGDTELIPLISQVLRKPIFSEEATREDVLTWWRENELKLRIPASKEEAEELYQRLQGKKPADDNDSQTKKEETKKEETKKEETKKEETKKEETNKLKERLKTNADNDSGKGSLEPKAEEKPKPIEKPKPEVEPVQVERELGGKWLILCLSVVGIVITGLVLFLLLRRKK